jgi:hypothetical protein
VSDSAHKPEQGKKWNEWRNMAQGKNVYSEKITTPIGRFSYPSVFQKSKGMDGAEGKYEVTLLIPKSTDISSLRKELETVAKEAFGTKFQSLEKLKNPPVRDGDEKDPGDPARGHWIIRAKSSRRPGVVGPDKLPIDEEQEIYGGCYGRLNVTVGSYSMTGNWGVTLFLNAVQKAKDGERFGGSGGSAEDAFEALAVETSGSLSDNF